jgi:hypothetical protein
VTDASWSIPEDSKYQSAGKITTIHIGGNIIAREENEVKKQLVRDQNRSSKRQT